MFDPERFVLKSSMNMDLYFLINNFHTFVQIFSNKFVNITHLAAGCQSGSWVMAEFSRFTPEAPEEEMEVDGDSQAFSKTKYMFINV